MMNKNSKFWVLHTLIVIAMLLPMFSIAQSSIIVSTNAIASTRLNESIDDMIEHLKLGNFGRFTKQQNSRLASKGIRLQLNASNSKSQNCENGQSFTLVYNSIRDIQISACHENGLINGIYTLMHDLGYRWFMPGDNWTIIPKKLPTKKISKTVVPDFRNRLYVGTGSISGIPEIDPKNNFRAGFELWNRRNKYSVDYITKGHLGQAFYTANKKLLDQHPEYFCNGKVNPYGWIDISNKAAVNVFVEWAISQLKPGESFPVIGVDPADGSGGLNDCLPASMPHIKTFSDKYYWLANQVAERIKQNEKNAIVQLYAYSNHTDIPGFKINPRVYPVIIPYAFQRLATPEQFINMWSAYMNGRPMGIYDYWNITQWSHGLPQFDMSSMVPKLKLWKSKNISGIHIESTYGKGAMGHVYYIASQLMWNVNLSFDSVYNDFLITAFGAGHADIKKMYDRWSNNFQNEMEVSLSLKDIANAESKTKDQKVLARLRELKAYIHYFRLYYEHKAQNTLASYQSLIKYLYQIHDLSLVQTSALELNYITRPKGFTKFYEPALLKAGKLSVAARNKMIDDNFKDGLRRYPASYTVSAASINVARYQPVGNNPKSVQLKFINGRNEYRFEVDKQTNFSFKAGATHNTRLYIYDSKRQLVYEKEVTGSASDFENIQVKLSKGTHYLNFGDYGRFSRLELPGSFVYLNDAVSFYDNAGYPLVYIYVPPDVSEIVYEDVLGPGTNRRGSWISPDQQRVQPQKIAFNAYKVNVPASQRGKVWTLDIGHRQYKILNFKHEVAVQPFVYQ